MFVFVYCAGHGVQHDSDQYMVLNDTSGNLFNIEQELKDLCYIGKGQCYVWAVFDMCKSDIRNYPGLTLKREEKKFHIERGVEMELKFQMPYYTLHTADQSRGVQANSPMSSLLLQ